MDTQSAGQRIGDRERDAAVADLQEHHVAGRLDRDEFDTRLATALAARTRGDLDPLFADLPRSATVADGAPESTPAPAAVTPTAPATSAPAWPRYAVPVLVSAMWPLTILICLLTGNWYLVALPILISMALGKGHPATGCGRRRAQLQRR